MLVVLCLSPAKADPPKLDNKRRRGTSKGTDKEVGGRGEGKGETAEGCSKQTRRSNLQTFYQLSRSIALIELRAILIFCSFFPSRNRAPLLARRGLASRW